MNKNPTSAYSALSNGILNYAANPSMLKNSSSASRIYTVAHGFRTSSGICTVCHQESRHA